MWKVISLSLAITQVEPTHTSGNVTGVDGITYFYLGDVQEFVLGNTYAKESNGLPTANTPRFGQMPDPYPDDKYAYKSVAQAYTWAAGFEGLKKNDVVLNVALDKVYIVLTDPCEAQITPTGTTPNTPEVTGDGYEYMNIGQGFEWKPNSTYNVNNYILANSSLVTAIPDVFQLYKIASTNDTAISQPTILTIGGKETTTEGYEYEYLGAYKNFTAGSITLTEEDLVYNGTDLYQVKNIVKSMHTVPTVTTGTETLDVGITYEYYGLDLPYTMTDTAKLGVAHLSIYYDPYDSKNKATYSTDRFELYSQSLSAKNIAYSKNGINRGTPIYRTYIEDIRNASAWVKAGGLLQFNVNMPLKNQYNGYTVGNEGLPSNCKFNIRLVVFDADEEEVQQPQGIQGPYRAPNTFSTA
eukprot:764103-Hanusia_phi.AAC.2